MIVALIERVENRRRQNDLSSNQRAGIHSRRQIRGSLAHWLRVVWRALLFAALLTLALLGMLNVFTPAPLFPYLAGATVASAFWFVYLLFIESSGFGHKRTGIRAEEWTAGELRSLRKHGWRVVNHVMLEHSDVDHALVGPGGLLAVETKFRSDWSSARSELDGIARAAKAAAQKLAPRMRARRSQVVPLVVMWGPGVADEFSRCFEHDGVEFCPAGQLREFVLSQPSQLTDAEIKSAFSHLDDYVRKRDRGERETAGLSPRTFEQGLNDAMIVVAGCLACTMTILGLARIPPVGVWAVIGGATIAVSSLAARRRWAHRVRSQLVTTAIVATAAGFAILFATVLLFL